MFVNGQNCTTTIRPLSKELQKKAETELNEDPQQVESDLQHIKEWLSRQPHLTVRQDDQLILSFLRGCKFSLQKTREKLDYYYSVRNLLPEYFSDRDPYAADVQNVLNAGVILPLPQTNGVDGHRILLVRWQVCDPTIISLQAIVKVLYMVLDIFLKEDDNAIVAGVHYISDYKHFAPSYLLQLTPSALHKNYRAVQAAYPFRIKKLAYINLPKVFDTLVPMLKSVCSEKLSERLSLYTDDRILFETVPSSILPREYGGSGASLADVKEIWKKKIESYHEWFKEDAKYRSNEKLRPDEPKGDAYGVDGTFRRLNID